MLFSDKSSDAVRDNLIRLVEASVLCLEILGSDTLCEDDRVKHAHAEIYDAMSYIVDEGVSKHSEYGFISHRAGLKFSTIQRKAHFRG